MTKLRWSMLTGAEKIVPSRWESQIIVDEALLL
jgi:hypothetical protein